MNRKAGFLVLLSSLFFFSACATLSPGCKTLLYSNKPDYYLKIISKGKLVIAEDSFKQSFQPLGTEKMSASPTIISMGGPLYPFDFVADQPKQCGEKIAQNIRLAFRGNIVFNGPFDAESGKWKVLYRDPSQDLQVMIKVVRKK